MASVSSTSKLTAPDLERLAFTPCPMASLASSGIKALSSPLARSWSIKALRASRNSAANSAQEFDELISTGLDARARRLRIDEMGRLAGVHATQEILFRR